MKQFAIHKSPPCLVKLCEHLKNFTFLVVDIYAPSVDVFVYLDLYLYRRSSLLDELMLDIPGNPESPSDYARVRTRKGHSSGHLGICVVSRVGKAVNMVCDKLSSGFTPGSG